MRRSLPAALLAVAISACTSAPVTPSDVTDPMTRDEAMSLYERDVRGTIIDLRDAAGTVESRFVNPNDYPDLLGIDAPVASDSIRADLLTCYGRTDSDDIEVAAEHARLRLTVHFAYDGAASVFGREMIGNDTVDEFLANLQLTAPGYTFRGTDLSWSYSLSNDSSRGAPDGMEGRYVKDDGTELAIGFYDTGPDRSFVEGRAQILSECIPGLTPDP